MSTTIPSQQQQTDQRTVEQYYGGKVEHQTTN